MHSHCPTKIHSHAFKHTHSPSGSTSVTPLIHAADPWGTQACLENTLKALSISDWSFQNRFFPTCRRKRARCSELRKKETLLDHLFLVTGCSTGQCFLIVGFSFHLTSALGLNHHWQSLPDATQEGNQSLDKGQEQSRMTFQKSFFLPTQKAGSQGFLHMTGGSWTSISKTSLTWQLNNLISSSRLSKID